MRENHKKENHRQQHHENRFVHVASGYNRSEPYQICNGDLLGMVGTRIFDMPDALPVCQPVTAKHNIRIKYTYELDS